MSEIVVYVTCESEGQAEAIGKALVEERMAACVNILGGMRSFYWWNGAVQEGREAVLIAKTRSELAEAATNRIKALHSYEVPCVVCLPITGGNGDFLEWIKEETVLRK